MKTSLLGASCAGAILMLTSTAGAALSITLPLEGRLAATPGGTNYQAYYDPNLDVTWAKNANINGQATWDNQTAWAAGLTINGIGGWRLPKVNVNGDATIISCYNAPSPACADNELDYMFWVEGITPATPGPFSNIQSSNYWYAEEYDANEAYFSSFDSGNSGTVQFVNPKSFANFAWAVHDGDVSAVPVPAAIWLLGSAGIALAGVVRRRKPSA